MSTSLRFKLLLCILLSYCSVAHGATVMVYKIRNVQGVVLTRAPTSARWLLVRKGASLVEGQLIQVTKGASVTIEEQSTRKVAGVEKDRVQLTLTKPIVTRMSRDLLRQIRLSTFFVDRATSPSTTLPEIAAPPLTLMDAWERLAAMVANIPPPDMPPATLAELERQGIALGVSAKKIHIISPSSNTVVQATDWPAEVRVVWAKPPSSVMRFHVYAWRAGSPRGSPVGETRQDFYTVRIQRPGTHFIQITSADGTWQSMAVALHAVAPMDRKVVDASAKSSGNIEVTEALALRYPPNGYVLASQASPARLNLVWDLEMPWRDASFEVSIKDASGKDVQKIVTRDSEARLSLRPGRYSWSVAVAGSKFRSVTRRFEVMNPEASKTKEQRRQILRTLISSGQDVTLQMADGI